MTSKMGVPEVFPSIKLPRDWVISAKMQDALLDKIWNG